MRYNLFTLYKRKRMKALYIQIECIVKYILKVFESMKTISPILERMRDAAGVQNDKELCKKIDFLNYATLDTWKNRDKIPDKKLRMIARFLGVDHIYLEFGEGKMLQQKGSVSQNAVGNGINLVSGLGNKISGTPSSSKECTVEIPDEDDMVDIPFLHDVVASAGGGAIIPQDIDQTAIRFSASFLKDFLRVDRFDGIHLISATGNSMEPTIVAGELLMVNPYENEDYRTKDGAIYVIICTDSVFVKRVYRNPISKEMKLISDNKDVDDIIIQGDDLDGCKIVGRVVGHFDKL